MGDWEISGLGNNSRPEALRHGVWTTVFFAFLVMTGLLFLLMWPIYSVTKSRHSFERGSPLVNWWSMMVFHWWWGF